MQRARSYLRQAAALLVILGGVARLGELSAQQRDTGAQQPATNPVGPQRIEMVVHGMSCPFCAYGLEKKLRKIEGVDSLSVNFKTGTVTLDLRDGSKASDERIRKLVKEAGFEVREIKRSPLPRSPAAEQAEAA